MKPSLLAALFLAASTASAAVNPSLESLLHQIFVTHDFDLAPAPDIEWLDNGAAYTVVEKSSDPAGAQDLVEYTTASGARSVLVSARDLIPQGAAKPLTLDGYSLSNDRTRLLIFTNTKPVWRRHTRGDYWLYNFAAKSLVKLGGNAEPSTMQFAKFSPDASSIAFVRANNLYLQNLSTLAVTPLTRDGSHTLINGASDWVYEEELEVRDGFRWSPDGRRIAYWRFDSSLVGQYPLINYTDSLYPTIRFIPYPKAGTTNSAVSICVVDIASGQITSMQIPGAPRDNYIARMEWAGNSNQLVIEQLNRLQNTARLFLADASTGAAKSFFEDTDEAWVDVNEIRPIGNSFLWLSERDGWRHAYLVPRDGSNPVLLTLGDFDCIDLLTTPAQSNFIYFTASPTNATQRYLYRASVDPPMPPLRLTPENEPGVHRYSISPNAQYAIHTFSTFDDPGRTELIRLPDSRLLHTFADNHEVRARMKPLLANQSEFFNVDIGGNVSLDGWMIRPSNFNPRRKYPVLVYVYGEPAAQTVLDAWQARRGLFHRALAQDGYIVVSFDNRGTPAPRGRAWRKVIYGSVGPLAAEEQTKAIRALRLLRPYLDADRIAVWGWSGGGTNTLNLMFRSPGVYKVGMAVAPVPDQRLYDTIYQERYMGTPKDNPKGYERGSAIHFAQGLQGKLLLVHGTGDDNVHFQGSQMLINRLVELDKQFRFMEYPNRTHAISEGPGTTIDLFDLLTDFLTDNLPPVPPNAPCATR
jgi:dipeptidyl-peptidase-4